MSNDYNEITVLKRLTTIQKIHEDIQNHLDVNKYSLKDRVAYLLWIYPMSRNSDICLSILFYKLYYSSYVNNNCINLNDFYDIPKMYDIQRTRAEVQNTEGLFPADEEIRNKRGQKAKFFNEHYRDKKIKTLKTFPEYYLYFDESGKNEKYFVLAGILLNGKLEDSVQRNKIMKLKDQISEKYNLSIKELKFADINSYNIYFYKAFIDALFENGLPVIFLSIFVENAGLKQKSNKNKTENLLKILLKELSSIIVRGTCASSKAGEKAKINILLDKDGSGFDSIEREKISQDLNTHLKQEYKYLIDLSNFADIDSRADILIQISDLYVSSLNNIFSKVKVKSETARCKKEFAKHLLGKIGLDKLTKQFSSSKSKVQFINKLIATSK